jgi:hypothetical protein
MSVLWRPTSTPSMWRTPCCMPSVGTRRRSRGSAADRLRTLAGAGAACPSDQPIRGGEQLQAHVAWPDMAPALIGGVIVGSSGQRR